MDTQCTCHFICHKTVSFITSLVDLISVQVAMNCSANLQRPSRHCSAHGTCDAVSIACSVPCTPPCEHNSLIERSHCCLALLLACAQLQLQLLLLDKAALLRNMLQEGTPGLTATQCASVANHHQGCARAAERHIGSAPVINKANLQAEGGTAPPQSCTTVHRWRWLRSGFRRCSILRGPSPAVNQVWQQQALISS